MNDKKQVLLENTKDSAKPPPKKDGQQPDQKQQDQQQGQHDASEKIIIFLSFLFVIITFPIALFVCLQVVYEYERAVILRFGRLRKDLMGPGVFFILPCTDDFFKVDLRTVTFDVLPQDVLTKDAVTIKLDAVVFFRVVDPKFAIIKIDNYKQSTMLLAQTTLRNIAGTKNLIDLLISRDEISLAMRDALDEATNVWGILVERVEIKDVQLPVELQRSMASEAEANRNARAKIIAADGEKNAANSLKEASDILSTNSTAIQMRYLETLHSISTNNNSTIIIPFPKDMARSAYSCAGSYACTCGSLRAD